MPRPDGRLYNFEKDAIAAEEKKGKPKVKLGRPPKPKPVVIEPTPAPRGIAAVEITGDYAPSKGGRPPLLRKLTPQAIDDVLGRIRMGLPIESALIKAGITRQAIDKWRQRNPALQHRFAEAEADFEADMVARINGFACNDTKSAQWLLERRMKGEWSPLTKSEVTGANGGPILSVSQVLFSSVAKGGKGSELRKEKRVKGEAVTSDRGVTILSP